MTHDERQVALDDVAAQVRACTRCRLHETRTNAVPGEGSPDTEVVFVGEGPGFHEDRLGRPFVGRAGDLLTKYLGTLRWGRDEVFITNVVKCRPPDNRDPEPDEIAACAPYLQRQLEVLDPALIVTLGRHSLGRFMPGERISQAHGTGPAHRSRDGRPERARLRALPPGGRAPLDRGRAPELRRRRADPGRAARGAGPPRARSGTGTGRRGRVGAAILADVTPEAIPDLMPDVTTDVTLF
jgi:uracil-DNA glycosylase family 4